MRRNRSGKITLVTGAAWGIGRGCAVAFARAGADVAINDRTETDDLRSVVAEIESLGRRAVVVAGDAFARESCERIAAELAPHRINVNVIEPGWIDTPGEREIFGDAAIAEHAPSMPWGRLGRLEDIGHAAAFLASDDADYVTGTVLRVDGGYWLRNAGP